MSPSPARGTLVTTGPAVSHMPRQATSGLACDNFLYEELQGRTFGAPGLTART